MGAQSVPAAEQLWIWSGEPIH
ncbi:protein of unknown function [Methylocella tundrae]|uniref:Uncharacterized protein n=1 Tax=Methylocella tundrae TaxID=227605 RepID=A0A4U8Z1Y6_METTU|nr:protein of unknown function [Methylocella tundrae]